MSSFNENNFIDFIAPLMRRPFVFIYDKSLQTSAFASYLYENQEKIESRQNSILLLCQEKYLGNSYFTKRQYEITDKIMSVFGHTIPTERIYDSQRPSTRWAMGSEYTVSALEYIANNFLNK